MCVQKGINKYHCDLYCQKKNMLSTAHTYRTVCKYHLHMCEHTIIGNITIHNACLPHSSGLFSNASRQNSRHAIPKKKKTHHLRGNLQNLSSKSPLLTLWSTAGVKPFPMSMDVKSASTLRLPSIRPRKTSRKTANCAPVGSGIDTSGIRLHIRVHPATTDQAKE